MAKFSNAATLVAAPKAAIQSRSTSLRKPDTLTYEGGEGFTRKTKGELFLLAVSNMVGEDTFYEGSGERDKRFRELVAKVTAKDPEWVARFVPYLRNELNMRSASVVAAVEYVRAGGPNGRRVIDSAIARADEPAEVLAYFRSRYGKKVPQPIKRGVADAVRRVYDERAAIKWDGDTRGFRMADVIELVHPEPRFDWQSKLYRYLLDKRHNRVELSIDGLNTISAYKQLMAVPADQRRAMLARSDFSELLKTAGMTWEALSGWLQGPMDAAAWEAIIPNMGYMALLRNLRNFEDVGISKETQKYIIEKLTDPEQVVKSRQFPLRFYSAYKAVNSLTYLPALEEALNLTLQNVPSLKGRTLILVDQSGSMGGGFSARATTTNREIAALFGAAVALRAESATIVPYADKGRDVSFVKTEPILGLAKKVTFAGGGTNTFGVLQDSYKGHDRVIILTDEQAWGGYRYGRQSNTSIAEAIKAPIYTFNLNGYKQGHLPTGEENRYVFGGLTDAGFKLIEAIEAGKSEDWPF